MLKVRLLLTVAFILLLYTAPYASNKLASAPENLILQIYRQHQPQKSMEISITSKRDLYQYFTHDIVKLFSVISGFSFGVLLFINLICC